MSTLLDLIQTKVNYVVQEAIVVIKDIFRKYPNKYGNGVFAPLLAAFAVSRRSTRKLLVQISCNSVKQLFFQVPLVPQMQKYCNKGCFVLIP